MQTIPTDPVPSQVLSVTLGDAAVTLAIYQKSTGLYCDIGLNNAPLLYGVACLDNAPLVISAYLGFPGDLAFVDTQGSDPPHYTGLGDRFALLWLEPGDLAP
jgi:hypothetical protein